MSLAGHNIFFASGSAQGATPASAGGSDAGQVCVPNISTAERRKRLVAGVIPLVVSLAILAGLMAIGANRWWRLPLFLLFWGAAGGFFQWRDKT